MYRVEVTANTLSELAGKLMALGSQLSLPTPDASGLAVASTPVDTAFSVAGGIGAVADPRDQVAVGDVSSDPESAAKTIEVAEAAEVTYDYNTQVAPRVLQMVAKRGRDAVKTLLSGFGVTKASELSADKYPALMNAINEAMEG
jgi:hypothetical protein